MSDEQQHLLRFLRRAADLAATGRFAEAIIEFEGALALAPDDDGILAAMADVYVSMGDFDRARDYARQAIAQNPENSIAFQVLARRNIVRSYPHDAYRDAKQAVSLAPDDLDALRLFGFSALMLGREEEALMIGELMLEQDPEAVSAHLLVSLVAEERNELPRAIHHVEKALELAPNDPEALEQYARLQKHLRQEHASADLYEAAVHADPHDPSRRSALQDSIHRLAVFGHPGERLQSIAALLSAGFVGVLGLWILATMLLRTSAAFPNFNRFVFFGVPVLAMAGFFLLRERFIAKRYPQLAYAFQYLRLRARRGILVGVVVIVVCVAGIALILARNGVDVFWVYAPLWLPFAGVWLALAMAPVGLLRAVVLDKALRARSGAADIAATAIVWRRRMTLALTAIMLLVTILSYSAWAWAPTVVLLFMSVIAYFQVYPYRAAAGCVLAGWCIARYSFLFPTILDLHPGMVGLGLFIMCLIMLYQAVKQSLHRRWQQRHIRKLVGGAISSRASVSSSEE